METTNLYKAVWAVLISLLAAASIQGQSIRECNQRAKFLAEDGAIFDRFGQSVAVAETRLVVGAFNDDDNGSKSGAAYVFDWMSGALLYKLLPQDVDAGDEFGFSVSARGNLCVVGAHRHGGKGAAYVFDLTNGLMIHKLTASDGRSGDEFGHSVAISENIVAVGAWKSESDDEGASFDSGAVYLYDLNDGHQIRRLEPQDVSQFDQFGAAVGFCNECVIVGSPFDDTTAADTGSAYVFTSTGTQLRKLVPIDSKAGDVFGSSVAGTQDYVVVGAPERDDSGDSSGAAFVYEPTSGVLLSKLLPADGAAGDRFGVAVSAHAAIVVGAFRNDSAASDAGAAYVFSKDGSELQKLASSDGRASDFFGSAVATNGSTFFVGSLQDDDLGSSSGSAFCYGLEHDLEILLSGGSAHLSWNSIPGATYEIFGSRDTSSWTRLQNGELLAIGSSSSFVDLGAAFGFMKFYKLVVR